MIGYVPTLRRTLFKLYTKNTAAWRRARSTRDNISPPIPGDGLPVLETVSLKSAMIVLKWFECDLVILGDFWNGN